MSLAKAVANLGKTFAGKKCAVVLSGCGVYDGSEIHESVFVLTGISTRGGTYSCFAPDQPHMHVINHMKGEPQEDQRNVMQESSRISRGAIQSLDALKASDFDALIIPGGFGVAKNLSNFATAAEKYEVADSVRKVVQDFHAAGKPMGFCCMGPIVPAKVIAGCEVTVGSPVDEPAGTWPYAGTAGAIDAVGGKHVVKPFAEAHVDNKNKVVTSAGYMYNGTIHEIHGSVDAMVEEVGELLK